MPSRRDAGRSQAARVLFEGGQRPAAGLDGGSSGSRRGRIQGQGIVTVAGSNCDSIRLSRRIEQLRHGGSQLRRAKGFSISGTVNALRFPIRGAGARHANHGKGGRDLPDPPRQLPTRDVMTQVDVRQQRPTPLRRSQKVDRAASPDQTEQAWKPRSNKASSMKLQTRASSSTTRTRTASLTFNPPRRSTGPSRVTMVALGPSVPSSHRHTVVGVH